MWPSHAPVSPLVSFPVGWSRVVVYPVPITSCIVSAKRFRWAEDLLRSSLLWRGCLAFVRFCGSQAYGTCTAIGLYEVSLRRCYAQCFRSSNFVFNLLSSIYVHNIEARGGTSCGRQLGCASGASVICRSFYREALVTLFVRQDICPRARSALHLSLHAGQRELTDVCTNSWTQMTSANCFAGGTLSALASNLSSCVPPARAPPPALGRHPAY